MAIPVPLKRPLPLRPVAVEAHLCLRAIISNIASAQTVQPTLNIMSANGNSPLCIPYPFGKCGEGSLCPHAVQVALATDSWGAVQAHPTSNGFLEDNHRGGQTFPKSTEIRNSVAFRACFFRFFSVRIFVRGGRIGFRAASSTYWRTGRPILAE